MGRSLIQVANQSTQAVSLNSVISLGSVQRRFGCNLRMSGNGIEVDGEGYYTIDCDVAVAPTAAGAVTVALYRNGSPITGAVAYGSVSTAGSPTNLSMNATIRQGCCCDSADNLTLVLLAGAGNVQNVSVRVVKE